MISSLRHAIRVWRRSPGFTSLVVLLFALGIGMSTAMFSILDAWLLQPLHFLDPARLVIVLKSELIKPTEPKIFVGYRDWAEWTRRSRSFVSLAGVFWRSFEGKSGADDVFGMIATQNLFDVLGVKAERGRTFQPADVNGPPVAVISHEIWRNRFGSARGIIGKTIALSSKNYQIVGVLPPGLGLRIIDQGVDPGFYALIQGDEQSYRSGAQGPIAVIGRLKPGVSIQASQAELTNIQKGLDERYRDNPRGFTVLVTNLQKDNTRNLRASLSLAAAAVGFVLLVVTANIGSLLLGRTLQRQREMAIRAALGSRRWRIIQQLLTEGALIAGLGAVGAVSLAYASIRVFQATDPFGRMPPNPIAVNFRTLAFTLAACVVSTLIFGLAPALQATRADLNDVMRSAGRGLTGGQGALHARALLVTGQVALSLMLLVGASLMMETLSRLESHRMGFRTEDLTIAEIGLPRDHWRDLPSRRFLFDRLLEKLKAIPGVQSAAISDAGPLWTPLEDHFSIEGQPEAKEETSPKAGEQQVTEDYFATAGIPLLEGRAFTRQDNEESADVVIVNQNAARRWFGGEPIGARVKFRNDQQWRTVVGVVGDTAYTFYNTIEWLTGPRIFVPAKQAVAEHGVPVSRQVFVLLHGRAIDAEIARAAQRSVDSTLRPGKVQRIQEILANAMKQPRIRTRLLEAFAAVALLLAAIGIYGLMAQTVIQRKQEIGIRVALGAQAQDLVWMVVGEGLRLAFAGVIAGVVCALLMMRALASVLYGVKPTDPFIFVAAAVVLLSAVCLASFFPARAAARVDPMIALREE